MLLNRKAAAERHAKLLTSIAALEEKRTAAERNRAEQQAVIGSSEAVLSNRIEIEAKAAEHRILLKKESSLAG